jgi:hypothetical protein
MLPPEVILLLLLSGDAVQEEEATAPPLDPEPEYVDTTEPFPRDRVLIYDGRDIGSGGAQGTGNTLYIDVYKGGITVLDMTMSNTVEGRINFGVTANQIYQASLRLWFSEYPDGDRLSGQCSYIGYPEASIGLSKTGCQLSEGGRYYINIAACSSGPEDYKCIDPGARTADEAGRIVVEAKYRRDQ